MEINFKTIQKEALLKGFYSEYLPPCFHLDEKITKMIPSEDDCPTIPPLTFTMSRYASSHSRRTIAIPEICSYLVLGNYLNSEKIFNELIEVSQNDDCSFSKILDKSGNIRFHEEDYAADPQTTSNAFMDNITKKLVKSTGAKAILKLDISNCYPSFYVHMIPAIFLGQDRAQEEYIKSRNRCKKNPDYNKYAKLDKLVRKLNLDRTNGLLVGPLYSKIIVEGLLVRIDKDLQDLNLVFTRYLDDYEICIYDDEQEKVINAFVSVLRKYGLYLNTEKTELIKFPYYRTANLWKIYTSKLNELKGSKLASEKSSSFIDLFNTFFELEEKGIKGAVRFLIKSLEGASKEEKNVFELENQYLSSSYLISILQNESRSLVKTCTLLIEHTDKFEVSSKMQELLFHIATEHLEKNNDLEALWLIYLLLKRGFLDVGDEKVINLEEKIILSNNELAKLLLLKKHSISSEQVEAIKDRASSWLLLYELFAQEVIEEEFFCERLNVLSLSAKYREFKRKGISFIHL